MSLCSAVSDPRRIARQSSVLSRLRAGIARNFVAAAFAQGSTFLLNLMTANLLGRTAFGQFTTVQTTFTTVGTLGQFATGYTATRYVAEHRERDPVRAGRIVDFCARVSGITGLLAVAVLGLGASVIASAAFDAPSLASPLRIAALGVPFLVMNGFRMGALAGLEGYSLLARVGVIGGAFYLIAGAVGAMLGGVNGAVAGISVGALAQWWLLGRFLRAELRRQGIPSRRGQWWLEKRTLLRFSIPASLSGFVTLPALWMASAFLVRQPGGFDQLALFGAANSFRLAVLFLPNTMNNVGMSVLNNQRRASAEAYRRVFWWNLGLTSGCAALGAAIVVSLGPWLLKAFGARFDEGYAALRILMVTAVTEAIAVGAFQIIQTHARMWLSLFVVTLPRDLLIVALAYALTPAHGAVGLALAHATGWAVALGSIAVLTYRLGLTMNNDSDASGLIVASSGVGQP